MIKKFFEWIFNFIEFLFPGLKEERKNDSPSLSEKTYLKKEFLSSSELLFYHKLLKLEEIGDYKIIPQVNLASIITKVSNNRYQSELYRNIDYAVFSKDLTTLLLLIELNDITHEQKSRKIRDMKVKDICNNADIKLITFYTKYDNKEEYVVNRVIEEINKLKEVWLDEIIEYRS